MNSMADCVEGWLGWTAVERGSLGIFLPLTNTIEAEKLRGQFAARTENHASPVLLQDTLLRRVRILEEAGRS